MFDEKTAKHLAELSKIEFTEDELLKMTHQMDDVIKLMDSVKKFPETEGRNLGKSMDFAELREDEPKQTENQGTSYVVPKII